MDSDHSIIVQAPFQHCKDKDGDRQLDHKYGFGIHIEKRLSRQRDKKLNTRNR